VDVREEVLEAIRKRTRRQKRSGVRVGLCGGVFAILHPGHIHFLKQCKSQCDVLVVVVANDERAKRKGYGFVLSQDERVALLEAVKYVDVVVKGGDDMKEVVEWVNPDVIFLGYDQSLPFPVSVPVKRIAGVNTTHLKTAVLIKKMGERMKLEKVDVDTGGLNIIAGHAHFIKTVEDLYETMVEAGVRSFGIAFCEASAKRLIRYDGTDDELVAKAVDIAKKVGAGHFFVIVMRDAYPIYVMNRVKAVSEVANVFCATANPVSFIVAREGEQSAVLGVMDGFSPLGVEGDEDKEERTRFLRKIGYKKG
jgi:cytidyltransferase-like protein